MIPEIEDIIINTVTKFERSDLAIVYQLDQFCKDYKGQALQKDFNRHMMAVFRKYKTILKKTDLIVAYRKALQEKHILQNITMEKLICKKPSRSISGITSITLVMDSHPNGQAFSCRHNCYYCPNEPAHEGNNFQDQPRSYLFNEPAVRRANTNKFLAFEQMIDRMDTLYRNGHTIDKLKIIIEGGTYTEYPIDYLNDFMRDIYYAANTYFSDSPRAKKFLDTEVYMNRNAKVHIIGVCIETRPDAIDSGWIHHFRRCGVTRIQLGIQTAHNDILKKLNRGHTIEQGLACMEYLKDLCFKIDIHIMPDLPFTTPELDKATFDYVYNVLQPDQMKIYPCAVVPWTVIEKWYNNGVWKPMPSEDLLDVMNYAMKTCPRWIRLPRVVRDIPGEYIQAGNSVTNLRQSLTEGNEIRSREIERHPEYYHKPAKIFVERYSSRDYFISYESLDKKVLFGFVRLRLPDNKCLEYECLHNKALIRELHVYGYNTAVGDTAKASQHRGIGTRLLKRAESIAYYKNYPGVAVISGEGVKDYYTKKGYHEIDTYMIKDFKMKFYNIYMLSTIILFIGLVLNS